MRISFSLLARQPTKLLRFRNVELRTQTIATYKFGLCLPEIRQGPIRDCGRGMRKQSKSRCINRLKKYPSIRLRTEWSSYFARKISQNARLLANFRSLAGSGVRSCYYVPTTFVRFKGLVRVSDKIRTICPQRFSKFPSFTAWCSESSCLAALDVKAFRI